MPLPSRVGKRLSPSMTNESFCTVLCGAVVWSFVHSPGRVKSSSCRKVVNGSCVDDLCVPSPLQPCNTWPVHCNIVIFCWLWKLIVLSETAQIFFHWFACYFFPSLVGSSHVARVRTHHRSYWPAQIFQWWCIEFCTYLCMVFCLLEHEQRSAPSFLLDECGHENTS